MLGTPFPCKTLKRPGSDDVRRFLKRSAAVFFFAVVLMILLCHLHIVSPLLRFSFE